MLTQLATKFIAYHDNIALYIKAISRGQLRLDKHRKYAHFVHFHNSLESNKLFKRSSNHFVQKTWILFRLECLRPVTLQLFIGILSAWRKKRELPLPLYKIWPKCWCFRALYSYLMKPQNLRGYSFCQLITRLIKIPKTTFNRLQNFVNQNQSKCFLTFFSYYRKPYIFSIRNVAREYFSRPSNKWDPMNINYVFAPIRRLNFQFSPLRIGRKLIWKSKFLYK